MNYKADIDATMEIVEGTDTVVKKEGIELSDLKQILGKVMSLGYDKINVTYTKDTVSDVITENEGE